MPTCQFCRHRIPLPSYHLSARDRLKRRFCSRLCHLAAQRARVLRRVKPGERLEKPVPASPHRLGTWAEVPPRCGVCGGLWRHFRGGVCCRSCGRDLFVLAALQPLVAAEERADEG